MREEALLIAEGADPGDLGRLHPGPLEFGGRHVPEIQVVAMPHTVSVRRESLEDLRADLEAARTDAGADCRSRRTDALGRRGNDATGEAAPVYGFASVVPLIPGVYVFQALQALESVVIARSGGVQALNPLLEAATNAITAAGILLALAIGVTSPVLLLPGTRTPED